MKNSNLVNEVNFGTLAKGALAGGAALYGANALAKKAGKFAKKNPGVASSISSSAGQIGSSLINLLAPVVKQVGPSVAKDLLKKKYNIDIPDSVINALSNTPGAATPPAASTPASSSPTPGTGTPPVLTSSKPGTASTPASPVSPAASASPTPTTTTPISKPTITKMRADPAAQQVFLGASKDRDSLKKKYGLKDDDTLDTYLLTAFESTELSTVNEIAPVVPAIAGLAGRALASNAVRQIGTQAALQSTGALTSAGIQKIQQKKAAKQINNNEMEENKKKNKKHKKHIKEGIASGVIGAVAGSAIPGVGPVTGGLVGGAAPGAIKSFRKAISSSVEDEESLKKKKKKKKLKESTDIINFIQNISQKNYAEANKYLESIISSKLKERIENSLNNNIF